MSQVWVAATDLYNHFHITLLLDLSDSAIALSFMYSLALTSNFLPPSLFYMVGHEPLQLLEVPNTEKCLTDLVILQLPCFNHSIIF